MVTNPKVFCKCLFILLLIWLHPGSQLQHAGSLIAAFGFSDAACGIQFSDQGSNPGIPCIGSMGSQPLDHQGNLTLLLFCFFFNFWLLPGAYGTLVPSNLDCQGSPTNSTINEHTLRIGNQVRQLLLNALIENMVESYSESH